MTGEGLCEQGLNLSFYCFFPERQILTSGLGLLYPVISQPPYNYRITIV